MRCPKCSGLADIDNNEYRCLLCGDRWTDQRLSAALEETNRRKWPEREEESMPRGPLKKKPELTIDVNAIIDRLDDATKRQFLLIGLTRKIDNLIRERMEKMTRPDLEAFISAYDFKAPAPATREDRMRNKILKTVLEEAAFKKGYKNSAKVWQLYSINPLFKDRVDNLVRQRVAQISGVEEMLPGEEAA